MSDYLDRVEAQLAELTEQGAHQRRGGAPPRVPGTPRAARGAPSRRTRGGGPRPPRRRLSEALAILAAAAVVAAVVAIVMVNVHHAKPRPAASITHSTTSTRQTATHAAPATAPGPPPPLPPHFAPQSFTAIGELTWWLLGPGGCPSCGAIIRTTNGGRSFSAIHAPPAKLASQSASSGYSQLRFADPKNGFAYGPDLYVTHDGGASWHPVDLNGAVTELAISAGQAFAVVEPTGGGDGRLMHTSVSRGDFSAASAAGAVGGGLWVQGTDVIVQSGVGTGVGGTVLVSHDGGQSFTAHPAPSPGLPCQFAAPNPPLVWARCATGTESGVWRSTDGGAHFTIAAGTGTSLRLPNTAAFAAASATTALVGSQQLYRTTNTGALWDQVPVPGVSQWAYLGFTDATHGAGLGYVGSISPQNERLYYTTDAGQSYHAVPLP